MAVSPAKSFPPLKMWNHTVEPNFGTDVLHAFGLWTLAVALPFWDVLSRNPEFFVAHQASAPTFLIVLGLISLAPPLAVAIFQQLLRGLSTALPAFPRSAYLLPLWLLASLVPLAALGRAEGVSATAAIVISAGTGLVFVIAYYRDKTVRSALSVFSSGMVLVPLWVVFFTPLHSIAFPKTVESLQHPSAPERPVLKTLPPIIFIIFDELASIALMDEDHEIDAVRFPNFADFARQATWFRRAASASNFTVTAVPAMLTGLLPSETKILARFEDHPKNLFTLLDPYYLLHVYESTTSLCPDDIKDVLEPYLDRNSVTAILSDSALVYLHIALPAQFRESLPDVTHTWKDFGAPAAVLLGDIDERGPADRRLVLAERFIKGIQKTTVPALHYLHVNLPHLYYDYLPTGQFYAQLRRLDGLRFAMPFQSNFYCELAQQRYLLQVGLVDRLVGDLVEHLRQVGLYDDALIVITSDHGVSFRHSGTLRGMTEENYSDLLAVPLFIKMPHQRAGRVSDRVALSIDLLPTIADALDIPLPWKTDGVPLTSSPGVDRKIVKGFDLPRKQWVSYSAESMFSFPGLDEQLRRFGSGSPLDELVWRGRHSKIIGKRMDQLDVSSSEGLILSIDQSEAFEKEIDMEAKTIPLYLSGTVTLPDNSVTVEEIAFAVNGKVVATSPVDWSGLAAGARTGGGKPLVTDREGAFRVVLPMKALKPGRNRLEPYLITTGNTGSIQLLGGSRAPAFQPLTRPPGPRTIESAGGRKYRVTGEDLVAYIKPPVMVSDQVMLSGWAVQKKAGLTASELVLFADGRFLTRTPADLRRPLVVKQLGPRFLYSGFDASAPTEGFVGHVIEAYALFDNGVAGPIIFHDRPKSKSDRQVKFRELFFLSDQTRLLQGKAQCGTSDHCLQIPYRGTIRFDPAGGHGEVEQVEVGEEFLRITGWAVSKAMAPPKAIFVFADDRLVYTAHPRLERPDVLEHLAPGLRGAKSGFDFWMPRSSEFGASEMRYLAAAGPNTIWELRQHRQ